jgi:hypothetical protein
VKLWVSGGADGAGGAGVGADGDASRLAVGSGVDVAAGPPTFEPPGRNWIPTTTATRTTAATAPNLTNEFIVWDLHGDHLARRWGVEGSSDSTTSRTRSGMAVEPASSQDRTMRVPSRSEFIG